MKEINKLRKPRIWTKEKVKFIQDNYIKMGIDWCAKELNFTKTQLHAITDRLGLRYRKIWTNEEKQFIIDNYEKKGIDYCVSNLNIPRKHIVTFAHKNNLKIKKYRTIFNNTLECTKCKKIKNIDDFPKCTRIPCGYACNCYQCSYDRKKERYHTDIIFNLFERLRRRTRLALKNKDKAASTEKLLGCTIEFFIEYFKSKMTPDMTWDDVMNGKIHIDHIKPCAAFKIMDKEEQLRCFNYTNLQPLWAIDNLKKRDKYIEPII